MRHINTLLILIFSISTQCSFMHHFNQGTRYLQCNNLHEALDEYYHALDINPVQPELLFNIGLILKKQQKLAKAISFFQKALLSNPRYAKAHFYLAECFKEQKQYTQALEAYEAAIMYDIAGFDACLNIIQLYAQQENYNKAIEHAHNAYARITAQTSISTLFSLAFTCVTLGQADIALALYDRMLEQQPGNINVLYNKAYTLKMAERLDEAIALYQDILRINPEHDQAHLGLAMSYITTGNFAPAWQESEYNFKRQKLNAEKLRSYLKEQSVAGKTILLCSQGGLGDSIQFIRCAQLLKEQGTHIIVCIQKPLLPLFKNCPYIDKLISAGSQYPPYDAYAGLMALPAVLGLSKETMAPHIPYLFPDPTLVEQWQQKLAHDTNFKIGICWHVSSFNDSSRHYAAMRSIPLTYFYKLTCMKNISLYSLQKKDGLDDLAYLPHNIKLITFDDFDETHGAFMDTAALIHNLDLIISADTSVAHLAGALGKPVWLLLPYHSDPRWLAGKADSPWYPTMRIFKQKKPFEWKPVIEQVMQELVNIMG